MQLTFGIFGQPFQSHWPFLTGLRILERKLVRGYSGMQPEFQYLMSILSVSLHHGAFDMNLDLC